MIISNSSSMKSPLAIMIFLFYSKQIFITAIQGAHKEPLLKIQYSKFSIRQQHILMSSMNWLEIFL